MCVLKIKQEEKNENYGIFDEMKSNKDRVWMLVFLYCLKGVVKCFKEITYAI